jgi:tetratricopeptide (TPR) repeat protein/DNA-binding CsgD family transcriptional regulator
MAKCKFLVFFLSIVFLAGCGNDVSQAEKLIARGKDLVNNSPDSTLALLDSIYFPERLEKELYHQYILLKIQAEDKTYKNIKEDSVIFKTKQYFINKNDSKNSALAAFYCGRVLHEKKELKEALSEYLNAKEYIHESDAENTLKALIYTNIGYIYYDQFLYEDAKNHYLEAEKLFDIDIDTTNKALINSYIGNALLLQGKTDSALLYYNRALDITQKYSIPAIGSDILQNIGLIYRKNGDYKESEMYLRKALDICTDDISRARILYNIAQVVNRNNKDSAAIYLGRAISLVPDSGEYSLQARIYNELAKLAEEKGNQKEANTHIKNYTNSIKGVFKNNQSEKIYDIQKKYNYEVLKNEQNQLRIERQYIIIISMVVIILLFIIAFILYTKLRKEKESRSEAEKNILYLEMMARDFNKKENTFRNRLLDHFNILKKSALLSSMLNDEEKVKGKKLIKKFNEIVYHQDTLDWNIMYRSMNELHEGFLDYLREQYPQLDESEFRICCLIYSDFSNDEIGVIMNLASSSITKKRSSIRRKLGITDYGNIQDFLKTEMESMKASLKKVGR